MPDKPELVLFETMSVLQNFWRSLSMTWQLAALAASPSRLAPPPSGEAVIISIISGRLDRPSSILAELRTTNLLNGDAGQQPQRRRAGSGKVDLRRHSATRTA